MAFNILLLVTVIKDNWESIKKHIFGEMEDYEKSMYTSNKPNMKQSQKETQRQSRNLKWILGFIILLFTCTLLLCNRDAKAQSVVRNAVEDLDRSSFTITAQTVDDGNVSQIGWSQFEAPILGRLDNKGLSIFYFYREYRVYFFNDSRLTSFVERNELGEWTYGKTATGKDKWSNETVIVKQYWHAGKPYGQLSLSYTDRNQTITYKIDFNYVTAYNQKE
ncbi:MAG: hypothetical protein ACTSQF_01990 [Candidatus Heimdallarchaeaceae archaeon]